MRLELQATTAEIKAKGVMLIKALASELHAANPTLSEALSKAVETASPGPRIKALKQLAKEGHDRYTSQLDSMLEDIEMVLLEPEKVFKR